MRAGLTAILVALTGCITTPKPMPTEEGLVLRLSPASLGRELQLSQRITVLRGDVRRSFDAQLEVDATAVRIAAVALGQTIASLNWDGKVFEQRVSAHVPDAVNAARILSDVQLAWWPADAIRAALPQDYELTESAGSRTILHRGSAFASLTYEGHPPAWAHVRLTHQKYGYVLDIESTEVSW